jgi:uncharacterized protein YpmB
MKKKIIIIVIVLILLGIAYYFWKKQKPKDLGSTNDLSNINDISENTLKELSKSISEKDNQNTIAVIDALKKDTKMPQNEKDMFLRVYKGILLAKRDKRWDENNKDIEAKKKILLSYGLNKDEIDWFNKKTSSNK